MSKRHFNAVMARTELFLKDLGRALNAAEDWASLVSLKGRFQLSSPAEMQSFAL